MPIEKVYVIKVENSDALVKTDALAKNFDKTTEAIQDSEKALGNLGNETSGSMDKVNKKVTESNGIFGALSSKIDSMTGGAITQFKGMVGGIRGMVKGLKTFKIALISTGIGAIVVVIGTLVAAFLSTQEGIDKLNSVMKPLVEVMNTLWGVAQKLGKGLFQMVSGDVTKGLNTMSDAVENLGDQMGEAYDRGKKLFDLQQQIANADVTNDLVVSRLNRALSKQLEISENINNSTKDRKKALNDAIALNDSITKIKTTQLNKQIELAKLSAKSNDTDRATQKDINALLVQKETIESDGIKFRTGLQVKLNAVQPKKVEVKKIVKSDEQIEKEKQAIADAKTEEDRLKRLEDIRKEYAEKERDQDAESEIEKINLEEKRALEELDRLKATEEEKDAIRRFYADERKAQEATDKEEQDEADQVKRDKEIQDNIDGLERKRDYEFALVEASADAFGMAASLAQEGSDFQRGLIIAEQTMLAIRLAMRIADTISFATTEASKTATAAVGATARSTMAIAEGAAQTAKVGFPQNIPMLIGYAIQAAAIIATVVKATKKASSIDTPKTSGSVAKPSYSIVGNTRATSGGQNATTSAVQDSNQEPIKAYVVSTEVTTQQEADRQVANNSSI